MTSKIEFTRKELNFIAKKRGIKEPQNISTKELLNTLSRYDSKRKVKNNSKKLSKIKPEKIAKIQNISQNDLSKAEKLQDKSIDELREIARYRRIKNYDNLTKEDLIISLLKSESNPTERNYMKYFNNSTSDDTYDDDIKSKINDIRIILSRLGNIVNDRKKIKKELYEIEKKQNLLDNEKEKIYDHLVKLANNFDKKEEYKHSDHDELDYFGIRKLENLFGDTDNDDYYKQVLVESYFEKNYKQYESRGDKDKKLSVKQYLYMIMPYLSDLINEQRNNRDGSNESKIQLNMGVNFISSNDTGEIGTSYVNSDNEEIRSGNQTDEIINKLLKSFLNNYQKEEKILRNGSNFIFESVKTLYYHIHKINLKRGKSYIKSPKWILNKRATINPKNKDNKCFQYAITAALNHQKIENHPERISNIKPFIDQYNWKGIDFPAGIKEWKKFEQNNKEIALNILSVPPNTKTINLAYKRKYNRERKNQVVLLMITDDKQSNRIDKWHYIALKSVPTDNGFNHPIRN